MWRECRLNRWTFCNQSWHASALSKKPECYANAKLFCSRSRSQWGIRWQRRLSLLFPSGCWFDGILWERERERERENFCVQDRGHSAGLLNWMFVRTITSELLDLLLPNAPWWCIMTTKMSCRRIFGYLQGQDHSNGYKCEKYDCFHNISWKADLFAVKFDTAVHYNKP